MGSVTITVTTTDGGKTATCAVTVTAVVTKPAPGGTVDTTPTQKEVDAVFGEGNATLDGDKITINNNITVDNTITVKPSPVIIDLGGNTITGGTNANPVIKFDGGTGTITGDGSATGGSSTGGNGNGGNGASSGSDSITVTGGGSSASGGSGSGSGSGGNGANSSGGNVDITGGGSASGGSGGNSGGNGGNGSHTESGSITVGGDKSSSIGGNGGSGATGGNGGNGTTGNGGTTINAGGSAAGGAGGNASSGTGGAGGNGSTDTGNIVVNGGSSGGAGGNGSTAGGSGGDGSASTGSGSITNGGSTTGGNGGSGATGGNGGNGTTTDGSTTVNGGGSSTGGTGGSGSTTGGNGGNGTSTGGTNTTINGGATGGSGGSGTPGSNGNGGNGGHGVDQSGGIVGGNGTATGGDGGSSAGTGTGGTGGAGVGGGATAGGDLTTKNGINAKVEVVGDAKTEVKLPDPAKTVNAVLTDAEKADKTITDVKVTLKVDDKTAAKPDQAAVESKKPANSIIGAFFDITLQKTISKNNIPGTPETVTEVSSGVVTITVEIPSGMRDGVEDSYVVIRVHNGTGEALTTTQSGNELTFETDKFSTYAIAYTKNATPPTPPTDNTGNGGGSSSDNREYDFWMSAKEKINDAESGDVLKVNAKGYDKMPASVMTALYKNGVGMVITWNGGKTITIPAGKAQKPEGNRIYYPLSLLAELYAGIEFVETPVVEGNKLNPETGGPGYVEYADGKQIPVTGGVTQMYAPAIANAPDAITPDAPATITPPTAGFEADAFAGTEDAKRATSGNTFAVIALMLAAAAVGGGVWFWKKKQGAQ